MAAIEVGIRELKARLSRYLREMKSGNSIIVTDRGRPAGRITAMESTPQARIAELAKADVLQWSGKKLKPAKAGIKVRGGRTVADLLLENRE
jgi:prevent-host-death family protein